MEKTTKYDGIITIFEDIEQRGSELIRSLNSIDEVKSAIRSTIRRDPTLERELTRDLSATDPERFPKLPENVQRANLEYTIFKTTGERPEFVDRGYIFQSDRCEDGIYLRSLELNPEEINERLKLERG